MFDYKKIVGYRKGIRPVQPESLPTHIDRELDRLGVITTQYAEALQDLQARLTAHGG